jgi:tRNA/rRNA methyltransferase
MNKEFLENNIKIVFIEPESSGNIGSIARVMKNFGLKKLFLVNPKTEVDSEAKALAMHGRDLLDNVISVDDIKSIIDSTDLIIGTSAVSGGDYNPLRANLSIKELNKLKIPKDGSIAILFGRESRGLSNRELNLCDFILSIPADNEYPTLNVSQAATIIFYELFNLNYKIIFQKSRLAENKEKELIIKFLDKILLKINYPSYKRNITERIFKNLIGRALITGREAYSIIGIFRRIFDFIEKNKIN